jgi:peptidoglycan/LPS O-acetylase OafA/YrhL
MAALAVMLAHTAIVLADMKVPRAVGQLVGLGLHGVTLFFVLSGFLLYRPFVLAALRGLPRPATGAFLRNRMLRIFPAYLVILLLAGVVAGAAVTETIQPGAPAPLSDRIGHLTDPVLLVLNLLLLQGYVPQGVQTGLSVSWSLVPEVAFYLALPLTGLVVARLARNGHAMRAAVVPVVVLLSVGFAGRVVAMFLAYGAGEEGLAVRRSGQSWSAVLTNSFLANADLFAVGMAVAVAVAAAQAGLITDRVVRRLRLACLVAIPFGGLATVVLGDAGVSMTFFGVACAGLVCYVMLPGQTLLKRWAVWFLELRPVHWLGLISYSVYLWHFPLLCFVLVHFEWAAYQSLGGLAVRTVLVSAAVIVLSTLTYRYVEAPALRRKGSTTRSARVGRELPDSFDTPRGRDGR